MVDFPHPDSPTRPTFSPSLISKVSLLRATSSLFSYLNLTSLKTILPLMSRLINFDPFFLWISSSSYRSIIANNFSAVTFNILKSGIFLALFPATMPEKRTNRTAQKELVIYRWLSRMNNAAK